MVWKLFALSLPDKKSLPIADSAANQTGGRFSPDGHWITFQSNETLRSDENGNNEVYVVPFPNASGRPVQVSVGGGTGPKWGSGGKEIFYKTPDNRIVAVPVKLQSPTTIEPGSPVTLFSVPPNSPFTVSPDGQRFLINTPIGEDETPPITIIQNWKPKP